MSLFWEIHQQGQIRSARAAAGAAQSAAGSVRTDMAELRRQLDKTMMILEAVWSLCREAHGWTDQQLVDRVTEIDLRDGQLDGKVRRVARPCPGCGRAIGADKSACMWCGTSDGAIFGASESELSQDDGPGPGGLAR